MRKTMKRMIVLLAALLCASSLFAQDIITKTDGSDIQAKVLEVGKSEVNYKRFSNLEGPTYTIDIAEVLMITYENGERDMFNNQKGGLPQGVMTYNSWSGKISVGGETIENELLDRFFTPEDLRSFKSGRTMATVGGIVSIVGAVPFGYGVGYVIGWRIGGGPTQGENAVSYKNAKVMALIGGAVLAVGLAINIPGEIKVKKAVNNYNQSLSYRPELHIGGTENGIGLAYRF